jgi:hypothetical protein
MQPTNNSRNATLRTYDLDLGAGADDQVAFFDGGNAAYVHTYRGVELEGAASGGGFWISEHDADFFANLIDKNETSARLRNCSRKFPQGLRHQPGLKAHMAIAHFAVEFGFRDEGGD